MRKTDTPISSLKALLMAALLSVVTVGGPFLTPQPLSASVQQNVQAGAEEEGGDQDRSETVSASVDVAVVLNAGVQVPGFKFAFLPEASFPLALADFSPSELSYPLADNLISFFRILFRQYISPQAP